MTQISLLNEETNNAINAAARYANPDWTDEAESAVSVLIKQGNDFTGDDVWRLLQGTGTTTPEPRALGAIIRAAVNQGRIVATGQYRKSNRRESHRRPLQVWRPVLYKRHIWGR